LNISKEQLVAVEYVGNKVRASDNVAESGMHWQGRGSVQWVTETQADRLCRYPDQWRRANDSPSVPERPPGRPPYRKPHHRLIANSLNRHRAKATNLPIQKSVDFGIDGAQNGIVTNTEDEAMRTKRVAIYARVSTDQQTTENQLAELRTWAERAGHEVVGEFVDHAISGANGRDKRPQFDRLLKGAARREFDVIAAWSVDRLGRSLQHLVTFLADIHASKIDLYLHQQGIDTTTAAGKALFQMCGVFAEFERAMIQERVKAGLSRARAQGKRLGRPMVSPAIVSKVKSRRRTGKGILSIAKELGIGTGTVQRIVNEAENRAA
jgi:DNA invertase Pin-like site-specific DNA recombinase